MAAKTPLATHGGEDAASAMAAKTPLATHGGEDAARDPWRRRRRLRPKAAKTPLAT